jgi:hypothetical protein
MDKAAVTLCLRRHGATLRDAFDATNAVLENKRVEVRLGPRVDLDQVRAALTQLGVIPAD